MPRVLYCARTCPPLEPPFPFPSPTATQQHVDLDDPNPPTPTLPDPNHQEQYYYESETDSDCPPSPPSPEQFDYSDLEDECPHLLNFSEYAKIALDHYNSQDKHEIKYQLIKAIVSCEIRYDGVISMKISWQKALWRIQRRSSSLRSYDMMMYKVGYLYA